MTQVVWSKSKVIFPEESHVETPLGSVTPSQVPNQVTLSPTRKTAVLAAARGLYTERSQGDEVSVPV